MDVSQLCSTEGEIEAQIRLSRQCSEHGRAGFLCKALTPPTEEDRREKGHCLVAVKSEETEEWKQGP